MTDELRIMKHEAYARNVARQMHRRRPWLEVEDVEGVALVALVEADRDYDQAGGATFKTLAFTYIKNAVALAYRSNTPYGFRRQRRRGGTSPEILPLTEDMVAAGPSAGAEEGEGREDDMAHADQLVASLPPDLAAVVRGVYLEGKTTRTLAGELGVSKSAVSKRLVTALADLRAAAGVPPAEPKLAWLAQRRSEAVRRVLAGSESRKDVAASLRVKRETLNAWIQKERAA